MKVYVYGYTMKFDYSKTRCFIRFELNYLHEKRDITKNMKKKDTGILSITHSLKWERNGHWLTVEEYSLLQSINTTSGHSCGFNVMVYRISNTGEIILQLLSSLCPISP
jgi:hypothetical protein